MRRRVASRTGPFSLTTRETVATETPASLATSLIVTAGAERACRVRRVAEPGEEYPAVRPSAGVIVYIAVLARSPAAVKKVFPSRCSTLFALVQISGVLQARARGVGHREARPRPERGAAVLPPLVDGIEIDVEPGLQAPLNVLVLPGKRGDPLQRLQGRFLRRLPLPHEFDDRVRAAGTQVPFPPTGRPAGSDLPVHVEASSDHGRIAEAARKLEEETGGRRRADDVASRCHRVAVDRALRAK